MFIYEKSEESRQSDVAGIPEYVVAVMTPTTMFGVPERPVALPVTLPVTLPLKFPLKLVAVATPVITAPSGRVGELPAVLPLKLVTLKSDIRDLLFVEHQ